MTAIAGVTVTKDKKGQPIQLSIDLQKHAEAIPALKELGLMPRTDFEKDCEDALPVKEIFDSVRQTIKTHYANRNHQTAGSAED